MLQHFEKARSHSLDLFPSPEEIVFPLVMVNNLYSSFLITKRLATDFWKNLVGIGSTYTVQPCSLMVDLSHLIKLDLCWNTPFQVEPWLQNKIFIKYLKITILPSKSKDSVKVFAHEFLIDRKNTTSLKGSFISVIKT